MEDSDDVRDSSSEQQPVESMTPIDRPAKGAKREGKRKGKAPPASRNAGCTPPKSLVRLDPFTLAEKVFHVAAFEAAKGVSQETYLKTFQAGTISPNTFQAWVSNKEGLEKLLAEEASRAPAAVVVGTEKLRKLGKDYNATQTSLTKTEVVTPSLVPDSKIAAPPLRKFSLAEKLGFVEAFEAVKGKGVGQAGFLHSLRVQGVFIHKSTFCMWIKKREDMFTKKCRLVAAGKGELVNEKRSKKNVADVKKGKQPQTFSVMEKISFIEAFEAAKGTGMTQAAFLASGGKGVTQAAFLRALRLQGVNIRKETFSKWILNRDELFANKRILIVTAKFGKRKLQPPPRVLPIPGLLPPGPLPLSLVPPPSPKIAAQLPKKRRPRVLLGVTGSVAAVKGPRLAVRLAKELHADVKVLLTRGAEKFWKEGKQTCVAEGYDREALNEFRTLVARGKLVAKQEEMAKEEEMSSDENWAATDGTVSLHSSDEEWDNYARVGDPVTHINMRNWADICVVAPLSANTLARLAGGMCDDLLTCCLRAWDYGHGNSGSGVGRPLGKPLILAPAMNTTMWDHPLTRAQLDTVQGFWKGAEKISAADLGGSSGDSTSTVGVLIVPPAVKTLACGEVGAGALAELDDVLNAVGAGLGLRKEGVGSAGTGVVENSGRDSEIGLQPEIEILRSIVWKELPDRAAELLRSVGGCEAGDLEAVARGPFGVTRCPATLAPCVKDLYLLWEEFTTGLGGRKPARLFTPHERGKVKIMFCRRKVFWDLVAKMVGRPPHQAIAAIDLIYKIYGPQLPVTHVINQLRWDRMKGAKRYTALCC